MDLLVEALNHRTVLNGAVWAVPTIAVATAAPAYAASQVMDLALWQTLTTTSGLQQAAMCSVWGGWVRKLAPPPVW